MGVDMQLKRNITLQMCSTAPLNNTLVCWMNISRFWGLVAEQAVLVRSVGSADSALASYALHNAITQQDDHRLREAAVTRSHVLHTHILPLSKRKLLKALNRLGFCTISTKVTYSWVYDHEVLLNTPEWINVV